MKRPKTLSSGRPHLSIQTLSSMAHAKRKNIIFTNINRLIFRHFDPAHALNGRQGYCAHDDARGLTNSGAAAQQHAVAEHSVGRTVVVDILDWVHGDKLQYFGGSLQHLYHSRRAKPVKY